MMAPKKRSAPRSATALSAMQEADRPAPARFLRGESAIEFKVERRPLAAQIAPVASSSPRAHGTAPFASPQGSETNAMEASDALESVDATAGCAMATTTIAPSPTGAASDLDPALQALRARIVGDLYKSAYHRVFAFTRRFLGDEEAEEVAHESFVRLLRVRNLERMTISVAYLLRIAENLIRRKHGRAQRYREVLEQSGRMVPDLESFEAHPIGGGVVRSRHSERVSDAIADADRLDAVLRQLTPSEQSAVRLIVCEGLDYQAAARSLGVPVSTINNWKHRALSKLKHIIESEGAARFGRVAG